METAKTQLICDGASVYGLPSAFCLVVCVCFVFCFVFFLIFQHVSTALVYDKQTLLTIRNTVEKLIKQENPRNQENQVPLFLHLSFLYREVYIGCVTPLPGGNGDADAESEAVFLLEGNCTWRLWRCLGPIRLVTDVSWF